MWPSVSKSAAERDYRMGPPSNCTAIGQYYHMGPSTCLAGFTCGPIQPTLVDRRQTRVAQCEQVSRRVRFSYGPTIQLHCYWIVLSHGPKPFIWLNVHVGPVNPRLVLCRQKRSGPVWACESPSEILVRAHQAFALLCDDMTTWAHYILLTRFTHGPIQPSVVHGR
jgi:hypothetical protein